MRNKNETLEQYVARLTESAITRWRTGLLQIEDRKQRAMGLALQNANRIPAPYTPYNDRDTPANNDLVLLAIESHDPGIYAIAVAQCLIVRVGENLEMAAGPCQGLSLEHWAQIDPDNAFPWLWIAARAAHAHNDIRTNEALDRAAHASRLASHLDEMVALALDALPPNVSPLEKAAAEGNLASIARLGSPFELLNLCSGQALASPVRKGQCSSIAKLLAAEGSTINDVALAEIFGHFLGWPEEQVAMLHREYSSFSSYVRSRDDPWSNADAGQRFECANLLRYNLFFDQLAAHRSGRAAMRAVIKLAGTPSP